MAAYLQTLKETYTDPGEALRIEWIDVDEKNCTIKINNPVKHHLPRQLKVSSRLITMINALPRKNAKIFTTSYSALSSSFDRLRKTVANAQQNPRILSVELRSFRHFGGTMIAFYTHGNVLTVMKMLGLKEVKNAMKYIGDMSQFKDDEFDVQTATSFEEAKPLLASGYTYVQNIKELMVYTRPKRFSKFNVPGA